MRLFFLIRLDKKDKDLQKQQLMKYKKRFQLFLQEKQSQALLQTMVLKMNKMPKMLPCRFLKDGHINYDKRHYLQERQIKATYKNLLCDE